MAHFAELSTNNVVQRVVVIADDDCRGADGRTSELIGASFCASLFGGGRWVQTSYSGSMRERFAGIGWIYDPVADVFVEPAAEEPVAEEPAAE